MDAVLGAIVEFLSGCQQPRGHPRHRGCEVRRAQPGFDIQAFFAQPLSGQVEAAVARVFTHVAGNVGQLHGHAQLAGAGQGVALPRAHHHRHHRAHGAGYTGTVGLHVGQGLVVASLGVPEEALEQAVEQGARHAVLAYHLGQRTVGCVGAGGAGVERIQPRLQAAHLGLRVAAEIDGVVGDPAKAVQRRGRGTHAGRQQQRGGEEGLRAPLHQAAQRLRVGDRGRGRGFKRMC
jgi:hypothetical protein